MASSDRRSTKRTSGLSFENQICHPHSLDEDRPNPSSPQYLYQEPTDIQQLAWQLQCSSLKPTTHNHHYSIPALQLSPPENPPQPAYAHGNETVQQQLETDDEQNDLLDKHPTSMSQLQLQQAKRQRVEQFIEEMKTNAFQDASHIISPPAFLSYGLSVEADDFMFDGEVDMAMLGASCRALAFRKSTDHGHDASYVERPIRVRKNKRRR